ncbi:MAG: threonylcarbamoyl-AMP synthase [Deltaproteobacteria bacterium]|nr:MAG: threonylcarbamoyl-AMP synthase [Deltaproteobacteria bacterium]
MDVSLSDAVKWIAERGVLAYPTETVWGLGADARSDAAVDQLRAFKGRGDAAPISILVTGAGALAALGFRIDAAAQRLAREFWPGPLTLVLPCSASFAAGVAREDGAVGVRCSPHRVASELAASCARAGTGPVTATSCNATGAAPARTRAEARDVCGGDPRVRVIADGEDASGEPPSTVVDVTGAVPRVLRWGALQESALGPVLEELAA